LHEQPSQLCLAWRLYAEDNRDQLVFASDDGDRNLNSSPWNAYSWTLTHMDNSPGPLQLGSDVDLMVRPLWQYSKSVGIYKCCADTSTVLVNGEQKARVRTMSMNLYVGGFASDHGGTDGNWPWAAPYVIYNKLSDISGGKPSPVPPNSGFSWTNARTSSIGQLYVLHAGLLATQPGRIWF